MFFRIVQIVVFSSLFLSCSEPKQAPVQEDIESSPDSSGVPEIQGDRVRGAVQDLPGLSLSDCAQAFEEDPYSEIRCEYSAEPRLLSLQGKLCAFYPDSVQTGQDGRKSLGFSLGCYTLLSGDDGVRFEAAELESPGLSEAVAQEISRAQPLANTESGTWFGRHFLDASTLSLSGSLDFAQGQYPVQMALGDLVDAKGDVNPDGLEDMIVAFYGERGEYLCEGEVTGFDSVEIMIFAALEGGSFGPGVPVQTGWKGLPMVPFGLDVLGLDDSGNAVLAIPAEPIGARLFDCLSEDFLSMPLIGTLKRSSSTEYVIDSLISDDSDRVTLNWAEPMGFARLPDGSGFLGSFSGGGQMDYQDGFSFIDMNGSVHHMELPYKGNLYPTGYREMELNFGATPFDLALAERDDGALIMVHTSRINGVSYLVDANGLYLTAFHPDGTQQSWTLPMNGRPIGLFPYQSPAGDLFLASSSTYSADARALGLVHGGQLGVWQVDGIADLPPFTSELYSAP